MLSKITRKRIKERKIHKHSNPAQLIKRVKDQCNDAIKDLTLVADEFEEKDLEDIFTDEKIDPLLRALLEKRSKRVFGITESFAYLAFQKLVLELPNDVVNNLGGDIGKTWTFAKMLKDYSDKPLMRQT